MYLYQVNNVGGASSLVEQFTLSPFTGADGSTNLGYLTGGIPAGFLASPSGQMPGPNAYINAPAGPLVTFYYSGASNAEIESGEHSVVMYLKSSRAPDLITGQVIDGSSASGLVAGPTVPEPGALGLLALTGLGLLRRGVRNLLCEAPFGPFRQKVPDPLFLAGRVEAT